MSNSKKKILVVDDSELNRSLLSDMLSGEFDIMEAENGMEAMAILQEHELDISLMLLDIVMPIMDGFEVLALMNQRGWIKSIPVIMISAETGFSYIDRAYDLGAVDYISRPFDERTVKHRVASNYMLSLRQSDMANMLSDQIYEKEKSNRLMVEILSHIVEFRNGESGLHVLHVYTFTEMILKQLLKKTDKYAISADDIHIICNASALHDIGKISIPSEIINKPGRLTKEEFEIMKTHTVEGAKMLDNIPFRNDEQLIRVGYEICRWHHERYDGGGYPDGLKGDDIPIAAQVVALADVYDALTSKRVYKDAFAPEEAVQMILNGECGAFNPLLIECLTEVADDLKKEMDVVSFGKATEKSLRSAAEQMVKLGGTDVQNRTVQLLERERLKYRFLSDLSHEIIFEYNAMPEMIVLSEWGAEYLGMPEKILDPTSSELGNRVFNKNDFVSLLAKIRESSPEHSILTEKYLLNVGGNKKWYKVIVKSIWGDGEVPDFEGAIGKIVDVDEETTEMRHLQRIANQDSRTGLLNHNAAKQHITKILESGKSKKLAMIFFDLDNFKIANDEHGHLFGDEILENIGRILKKNSRGGDVVARMGGDEFIIFLEYKESIRSYVERVFSRLTEEYKGFTVSISMGIACVENRVVDYETLFHMAEQAAYEVKLSTKNGYCFYGEEVHH
ncbi:MAG: diguanylate cyclase [Roseburia sp.]|nr:diguanylate cyclase [Roseburia sp.]